MAISREPGASLGHQPPPQSILRFTAEPNQPGRTPSQPVMCADSARWQQRFSVDMLQVPVAQQILRPHDRDLQLPAGQMIQLVLAPTVYRISLLHLRYLSLRYGYRTAAAATVMSIFIAQEQPYSYSYCSSGRGGRGVLRSGEKYFLLRLRTSRQWRRKSVSVAIAYKTNGKIVLRVKG